MAFRFAFVVAALAAASGACTTSELLGELHSPCDAGCDAAEVVSPDAEVASGDPAELLRLAAALAGTFRGQVFAPAVDAVAIEISFFPDEAAWSGTYRITCLNVDACPAWAQGQSTGSYGLTAISDVGNVEGYLILRTADFAVSATIVSLRLTGVWLSLLLADPLQLLVTASRVGPDGLVDAGLPASSGDL